MTKTLEDIMEALPKDRRVRIEKRGQELLDEYLKPERNRTED
jgi:hypothetical protein